MQNNNSILKRVNKIISAKNGMDTSRVYYDSEEIPNTATIKPAILARINQWNNTKPERTDREEIEDAGWDDLFSEEIEDAGWDDLFSEEIEDAGWDDLFSEETTSGEAPSSSPARSTSTSAEVIER